MQTARAVPRSQATRDRVRDLLDEIPLVRDVRSRRLYAQRAEQARVPRSLRGLDSRALPTWLKGAPAIPPGAKLAPTPPQLPVFGHFRNLGTGPQRLANILRMRDEYGDVVRLRFGGITAHLFADPEHLKEIFHTRNKDFDKYTRGMFTLRLVLGQGLLTADGSDWLKHRRIAQPAFHRKKIASWADRMVQAAEDMCDEWSDGDVIDAHAAMMRVTMRVVGETLLGTDVTAEADSVGGALDVVIPYINERVNAIFNLPPRVPTKRNRAFMKASSTLDDIVMDMIRQRRKSSGDHDDLLQMLMDTRDADTGERMDDAQLRDEAMTIFLAGHETTANALSWALYLLSKNPVAGRELDSEIDRVLAGQRAAFEHTRGLTYTMQVIEETMRLYPPAWMIARSPVHDTEVGGYFLPARSLLFLSPWVTHRHPDIWSDPEGFDPDRFHPDRRSAIPKYAYFPFGGGPRVCIGNNFALMEAQLILATIRKHWHLHLIPGHPVEPQPQVTLRPSQLKMVVRKRKVLS